MGLLGLVILALDIVAIVDCAKSNADTGKKVDQNLSNGRVPSPSEVGSGVVPVAVTVAAESPLRILA